VWLLLGIIEVECSKSENRQFTFKSAVTLNQPLLRNISINISTFFSQNFLKNLVLPVNQADVFMRDPPTS
jgi:hypothetical protein